MANIYYDPEKYGLTLVAEADFAGAYEFSTHLVFRKQDGSLGYVFDSGCSCPTPFEDTDVDDLKPVSDLNELAAWVRAEEEYEFDADEDNEYRRGPAEQLLGEFLDKVREAQRASTSEGAE